MTFGLMSTKWRIFRSNLKYGLKRNILIHNAAARLHNFIIDNDKPPVIWLAKTDFSKMETDADYEEIRQASGALKFMWGEFGAPLGWLPWLPNKPKHLPPEEIDKRARRERILETIIANNMQRPWHNKNRNNDL